MNKDAEIDERMGRVEKLRKERGRLRREVKDLNGERKIVEEQIEELLDEVRSIREGEGVQETLGAAERVASGVKKLAATMKKHGATMTISGPDGAGPIRIPKKAK